MSEPNVFRHFLHSAFIPPSGGNRGRVRDATLDALLDDGDRIADPDTRRARGARARRGALDPALARGPGRRDERASARLHAERGRAMAGPGERALSPA